MLKKGTLLSKLGDGATPTSSHTYTVESEIASDLVKLPSAALVRAVQRAGEFTRHTKADSTQKAYAVDWERFEAWAGTVEATVLPASPAVVCAHLGWLAESGYSMASIERFLASASHYHRAAGLDFQRNAYVVTETLEGIRRTVGVKRIKKAPLSLQALIAICKRLRSEADTLTGAALVANIQQRALLTVGWFCMLRSANLVAIQREHVRLVRFEADDWVDDDEQPDGLILHLPISKVDQRKEGRDVAVHAQGDDVACPVHMLVTYFRARSFAPTDLIFTVSKFTVTRLVKRMVANPAHGHTSMREITGCESCAAAARRFASHSLRRGAATAQAKRGAPDREIMRQGGWKSERTMRGYIEYATLFENNPTKDLSGAAPADRLETERLEAVILAQPRSETDAAVAILDGRPASDEAYRIASKRKLYRKDQMSRRVSRRSR